MTSLHCRWHRIHTITPHHYIYDVTITSGMTSHHCIRHYSLYNFVITTSPHWYHTHFWMTSQPPSVWHLMHYIEHHIQSLCHHTTVLMTSQPLYMKPHQVCRATYTLYMRHRSHYLCPHTHCIDNITPTLCMSSHLPCVWHRLHYTRHHILTLWPQTTVFFSSHPLYWTSCPLYLCHHLKCTDDITPTVSEKSHPL